MAYTLFYPAMTLINVSMKFIILASILSPIGLRSTTVGYLPSSRARISSRSGFCSL